MVLLLGGEADMVSSVLLGLSEEGFGKVEERQLRNEGGSTQSSRAGRVSGRFLHVRALGERFPYSAF